MGAGLSAGLSLGGGIAGLLGAGNASNVQLPSMFQMPNMPNAAGGAYSGIGGLGQYNLSNLPEARNITKGLVNNPYAGQYQQGANFASPMGQNAAVGAYGAGGQLMGLGTNTLPAWASSIFTTSMDPQSALYNRTAQQVQDQTRASLAATGVGTTPYGAGIEAQNMANFNIDWQNNNLNRQIAGAQAGGGLLNTGAGLTQTGAGLQAQAPLQYAGASGIPYGTFGQIGQGQLGALSGLQSYGQLGANIPQQQIQDYLSYISAGNQAGGVANQLGQLGLNQNQQSFNQYATSGAALGGGLYGLGRAYGGGNPWGGFFPTNPSPYAAPGGYGGGPYGGAPGTV